MLDVDKQPEWECPKHGVFAPKPCDNIARFLRKPKGKRNETLPSRPKLQQSA